MAIPLRDSVKYNIFCTSSPLSKISDTYNKLNSALNNFFCLARIVRDYECFPPKPYYY